MVVGLTGSPLWDALSHQVDRLPGRWTQIRLRSGVAKPKPAAWSAIPAARWRAIKAIMRGDPIGPWSSSRPGHPGHGELGAGAWVRPHRELVAGYAPDVELPPGWESVLRSWATIAPLHAPSLAAAALANADRKWWRKVLRHTPTRQAGNALVKELESLPGEPAPILNFFDLWKVARRGPWGRPQQVGVAAALSARQQRDPAHDFEYALPPIMEWQTEADDTGNVRGVAVIGPWMLEPSPVQGLTTCRICAEGYEWPGLDAHTIYFTGSIDYCRACAEGAQKGHTRALGSSEIVDEATLWAVRELVADFGGMPPREYLRQPLPVDLATEERDRAMLLRILLPELPGWGREGTPWGELVLRASPDGTQIRTARGIRTLATDGHICTSLFERVVDDFLHLNGIEHTKEVEYPFHAALNTTRLRADWQLDDGTYVEAFGMASVAAYKEKMERKRLLVRTLGVSLLEIEPSNLSELPQLFSRFIPPGV